MKTKIQVHHEHYRATYSRVGDVRSFELRERKNLVVAGRMSDSEDGFEIAVGPRALPVTLSAVDWFILQINRLLEPAAPALRDRND